MKPNLCNLFQPASQRDEDEEHGRRVEERDWVDFCFLHHGHDQDDQRVAEGYGGGQNDEHIHVGRLMLQCFVGLNVEVTTSNYLREKNNKTRKYSLPYLKSARIRCQKSKMCVVYLYR